jgi:hypothetical protein
MRSLALFSISLLLVSSAVSAEPWTLSADVNLTATQSAFSDNWVGGEAGALSWALNSNWLAEKQLNPKLHTKNTLKLLFGQTHNQDLETKNWSKPVKSNDLIDFESVLRITMGWFVDPYAGLRIESLFLDQSDPELERYINPVKFTESVGIAKVFFKEENRELMMRLGAGFRQFLDRDRYDAASDTRDNFTSNDAGFIFDADFKTPLAGDKITYQSKLTVYQAYYYSEKEVLEGLPEGDYWKAPDVNWENTFSAGITEYLMVSLYVQLLYNKEVDLAGRFKQTLALGFTYKLL